jgi:3-deoxy-manno-octulosonate cytidylyltransferase (CMP-KDO synthetase)
VSKHIASDVGAGKVDVAVAIPARFASTRLAGKLLLDVAGRPLIQYTWERASLSQLASSVVIAADDERIIAAARSFGARAEMTDPGHKSGTDRIAELVRRGDLDGEIVVNVQGDEPEIDPRVIDSAVRLLIDDPSADIATVAVPIGSLEEYRDPNAVKIALAESGFALYFSRATIPFVREGLDADADFAALGIYRHVGLYAYRREELLRFSAAAPSRLERLEKLEQLRALDMGLKIKVAVASAAPAGIDTREDFEAFVERVGLDKGKEGKA